MAETTESTTTSIWKRAWDRVCDRFWRFVDWLRKDRGWDFWMAFALLVGVVILLSYTLAQTQPLLASGVGLLIAGAASAVGILTGFLFGIPRSPQREAPRQTDATNPAPPAADNFGVNTNLEQISDWLTKIIVGVGLVQLTTMPGHLMSMAEYLSGAFGAGRPVPEPIVNLIMAYFAVFSFLLGYLWTRLYLADEFSKAERVAREQPEFLEGIIHALLYRPAPFGYAGAIKHADEYLKRFGEGNERVFVYQAMALAQQYKHMKQQKKTAEELKQVREKAFAAASRACDLDDKARAMLYDSWRDGKPGEDDMNVFRGDDDPGDAFKKLLEPPQRNNNPGGGS